MTETVSSGVEPARGLDAHRRRDFPLASLAGPGPPTAPGPAITAQNPRSDLVLAGAAGSGGHPRSIPLRATCAGADQSERVRSSTPTARGLGLLLSFEARRADAAQSPWRRARGPPSLPRTDMRRRGRPSLHRSRGADQQGWCRLSPTADVPLHTSGAAPCHERTYALQQTTCGVVIPYSITSSARARSCGGTVRSSILAVWALMTSSNLLVCTTGKSAGLAPFRMRPA